MAITGGTSVCPRLRSHASTARWAILAVVAAHLNLALVECGQRATDVFYLSWRDEFETSAKQTAAVQSIMSSLGSFSGLIGGVMIKRFGCRMAGIVGGLLAATGVFGTTWVRNISQLYLAAAVAGMGLGISVNTSLVAVGLHFTRRYTTANAVAYSGSGTGKIAAPPLMQLFLIGFGWRGALLIISGVMANVVALATLYRRAGTRRKPDPAGTANDPAYGEVHEDLVGDQLEPRNRNSHEFVENDTSGDNPEIKMKSVRNADHENRTPGQYSSLSSGRDDVKPKCTYLRKVLSGLGLVVFRRSYRFGLLCFLSVATAIPYFGSAPFVIPRAQSIGVTPTMAALLLTVNGVGGLVGRLGNGLVISWKLSAEIVCFKCAAVAGVSLLLMNVDSYVCLSVSSFLFGLSTGVLFSIFIVLTRRYGGVKQFSVCCGIYYICLGIGGLLGPVGAGSLFDSSESYKTVFYVLAGIYFVCGALMFLFPVLRRVEPGIDVPPSNE
ncbi:monocarboxylate transporter 3-like [Acanthaster planci]|uniref:Monocarboxylate transporter 3-like n=1 Tax=Acanthaster planci TaxID=133434 RepID=A0A8B7YM01_ACAPL|nr:monocarboxylate transporter 3-like [Acanthaster planci]XP_022093471.1 monocarboxylate transporter 3-like [Acanthaster planci]